MLDDVVFVSAVQPTWHPIGCARWPCGAVLAGFLLQTGNQSSLAGGSNWEPCPPTQTRIKLLLGTSLVAQWFRIRLPMQGTWVRALVWEDPTYRGAAKPLHHNY